MDRRNFVRNLSFVTAASTLGGSSLGCAANQIYNDVPCLALATVPAPAGNMTYLQASEIGCALDCDLGTGLNKKTGGAATDDAPTINAAMAAASASNPITLIIDGGALISGLYMPAGGYWGIQGQGCTTGFFIKAGANSDGIHNGGPNAGVPADPGPNVPLPSRGSNVTLANFVLNGNRGNGLNGDSTSGIPQGVTTKAWYVGINLMNLNNILIENVVVTNSPSYHFRFSNTGFITVSGCVMSSSGLNTDGLHFDGPANDIAISNCMFTTGDDAIALNCPEGYSGGISRVSITGCTFNSFTMVRLYTGLGPGPENKIDSVTVSNCSGTLVITGFLVAAYGNDIPNADLSLSVSNCQVFAPSVLDITTDFSSIALSGVTFIPTGPAGNGYAFARTYSQSSGTPYIGASLSLADCTIQRMGNYPVAALMLPNGSTIEALEFSGFALEDPSGTSYDPTPELLNLVSGRIGQLTIDALTGSHIAAPVSPGGFASIGAVSGGGVLGTGWAFPDSVMTNGAPYISATSQQPSIKVNGVVKPYP
ncbi:MAG TPA: glycosyl hydrolase family 28 protein [Bryobacteraceae bacterium]|jgi:hypothetical protein